jgi:hypothetical protein
VRMEYMGKFGRRLAHTSGLPSGIGQR